MDVDYQLAYWGILIAIATLVIQGFVAAASKANQPDAVPGKIDDNLSHDSFVFRSNRTFMNSLENFPAFIAAAFLAILIKANALWVGALIMTFAIARIIHMVLYYVIATEKNPSPRSYFFLLGLFSNIALLIVAALALI